MGTEVGRRTEAFFLSQPVRYWERKDVRTILSCICWDVVTNN